MKLLLFPLAIYVVKFVIYLLKDIPNVLIAVKDVINRICSYALAITYLHSSYLS